MNISIMTPVETITAAGVAEITAESEKGFFSLLPRHIDYISALVPGILTYKLSGGSEVYVAVDEGILVKKGPEVSVSVLAAIKGGGPGTLKQAVSEKIEALDEQEKKARAVLLKLESDFIRRFLEIK